MSELGPCPAGALSFFPALSLPLPALRAARPRCLTQRAAPCPACRDLQAVCSSLDRAIAKARSLARLLRQVGGSPAPSLAFALPLGLPRLWVCPTPASGGGRACACTPPPRDQPACAGAAPPQRDAAATGADSSVELAKAGVRILNGLRSLHVLSQTGRGREMEAAAGPVRAAWADRDLLFTAAQRKQLEGWLRSSRSLAALLPRHEAGLFEAAQPSQQPPAGAKRESSAPAAAQPAAAVPKRESSALAAPRARAAAAAAATASGTSAANGAARSGTASVGDKRSQASDEDSSATSGTSSKRSKPGPGRAAAAAAAKPATAAPARPLSRFGKQQQQQQQAAERLELLPPLPPPLPPPPPLPAAPAPPSQQASPAGSASMELDDSRGPSAASRPPSAPPGSSQVAESALRCAPPLPAETHQFHGVAVSDDVRGLLG